MTGEGWKKRACCNAADEFMVVFHVWLTRCAFTSRSWIGNCRRIASRISGTRRILCGALLAMIWPMISCVGKLVVLGRRRLALACGGRDELMLVVAFDIAVRN